MHTKLLVLLSLVMLTACTNNPVADANKEAIPVPNADVEVALKIEPHESFAQTPETGTQDKTADATQDKAPKPDVAKTPPPVEKTAEELADEKKAEAQEKVAAEKAKAQEKLEKGRAALAKLNTEYKDATTQWRASLRTIKPEDRAAAIKATPALEFGPKYIALAGQHSGTDFATEVIKAALTRSGDEEKKIASNRLLEMAEMDSGPNTSDSIKEKVVAIRMMLAQSGAPEAQDKAITLLLDSAKADLESEATEKILNRILSLRIDADTKNEAAELLLKLADDDIRSNKAAEQFAKVATSTSGDVQMKALDRLLEHHVNSDKVDDVMNQLGRGMPSETTEKFLKEVCRKATKEKIKGNAAVALSNYINRRDMYRNFYGDAEESVREKLDQDMLAYLEKDPDPSEVEMIESIMETYVNDNEKLMEKIKKQLFVVQNLSVGKTAPEITATDLDGIEFSLSDYRGKVVFLDFWGDW